MSLLEKCLIVLSLVQIVSGCGGNGSNDQKNPVPESPVSMEQVEAEQHQLNKDGQCSIQVGESFTNDNYKEYSFTQQCKEEYSVTDCDKTTARLEIFKKILNTALKYNTSLTSQNKIKAMLGAVVSAEESTSRKRDRLAKIEATRTTKLQDAQNLINLIASTNKIEFSDYWLSESYGDSDSTNDSIQRHNEKIKNFFLGQSFSLAIKDSAIKSIKIPKSCYQNELKSDGTLELCDYMTDEEMLEVIKKQMSVKEVQAMTQKNQELYSTKNIFVDCLRGYPSTMKKCASDVNVVYSIKDTLNKRTSTGFIDTFYSKCQSTSITWTSPQAMYIGIDTDKMTAAEMTTCINSIGNP